MITRYTVIAFALTIAAYACASSGNKMTVDAAPDHLSPPPQALVIEVEIPDWTYVCLRQLPGKPLYRCITVGDLRDALENRRRANWKSFLANRR